MRKSEKIVQERRRENGKENRAKLFKGVTV